MSYTLIDTAEAVAGLVHIILDNPTGMLFTDIESTGLDWLTDEILLFQVKHGENIYVIDVRQTGYEALKRFLNWTSTQTFVFHNAKFDLKFLYHRTGVLKENIYDTMITEVVLNSGIGKKYYSLEELAEKYAGVFMNKETRLQFVNYPKDKPFTEAMLQYSALDVKVLEDIYVGQMEQVIKTYQEAVVTLENDLIPIVSKMEMDGIRLNVEKWLEVEANAIARREELNKRLKDLIVSFLMTLEVKNAFELARKAAIPVGTKKMTKYLEDITSPVDAKGWFYEKFNTASANQMKSLLNLMQIKVKNTNEKTLEDFKGYPIIDLLLQIREVNKQISSYGSNILSHIHPKTGKIHTEYLTVGTQTGRFSSNKPNMQQVPNHGGYRECFIPDEGFLFADADYSQQEYRFAGAVSKDPAIIKAYQEGSDMHTATAQKQFGKTEVTKDERGLGKTINFAVLYGSTEFGLKKNLQIPMDEAKEILNKFWSGYPKLSKFMEFAGKKILELGFSTTPLGRRRYNEPKPTFMNSYEFERWQSKVLREGRNHIIQGGGADTIKLAIVEIFRRNPFGDLFRLCLQVHDQLVAQVHESIAEEGLKFMVEVMEEVEQRFLGSIPAKADGELKAQWSK
jgi:DNA polymerase-1